MYPALRNELLRKLRANLPLSVKAAVPEVAKKADRDPTKTDITPAVTIIARVIATISSTSENPRLRITGASVM
jgi:hypothetical protein